MKTIATFARLLGLVLVLVVFPARSSGEIQFDIDAESRALRPALQKAEQLVGEGRLDEANQVILAVFPESTRTASQALALGNVLFKQDPKSAYALHKRAAAELAEESSVHLEWGLEQHRARDYEGAAKSYELFAKTNAQFAPVYGLWAECLIRTGKIVEAVAMWRRSEASGLGTLDDFESLVCEVNSGFFPHRQRADLMVKARSGDLAAAEQLIFLDANFVRDWWNAGPQKTYLRHDRQLLTAIQFADAKRSAEMLTAIDCVLAAPNADVGAMLHERGLLLDDRTTLPQSGAMLSIMIAAAIEHKALDEAAARAKFGPAVLAAAKLSKDVEMFNIAAHLYFGTDRLPEIDQLGWDATGDDRFVTSLLFGEMSRGSLKLDDGRLARAAKQFPENSEIAGILVVLNSRAGNPMQAVLVQVIKAEYTRFSIQGGIVPRRSARPLREYFGQLANEVGAK